VLRWAPALKVLAVLSEDLAEGPERIDADDAVQAAGVGDKDVECEVAAPRMADGPHALELERVEHCHRIRHVRVHRVRGNRTRRRRSSLRVAEGGERFLEQRRAGAHVVGKPGPSVKNQQRRPGTAAVSVEDATLDRNRERLLGARHGALTGRPGRRSPGR
jgi:hypothetical protein